MTPMRGEQLKADVQSVEDHLRPLKEKRRPSTRSRKPSYLDAARLFRHGVSGPSRGLTIMHPSYITWT